MKNEDVVELKSALSFYSIQLGQLVSRRNMYDVIQFSKVSSSQYWAGKDCVIGNTPQQGINWIGTFPELRAVIVKTRPGAYGDDGWVDREKGQCRYSLKANKGVINQAEKANLALTRQPEYGYPVLLFSLTGENWKYDGQFEVVGVADSYVDLQPLDVVSSRDVGLVSTGFEEGAPRYVTHRAAERSRAAVDFVKSQNAWDCDICGMNFDLTYGRKYIEAHHKVPLMSYDKEHSVYPDDFALLCPNCHKAVHLYMKEIGAYDEVREAMKVKLLPA